MINFRPHLESINHNTSRSTFNLYLSEAKEKEKQFVTSNSNNNTIKWN